MKQEKRRSLPLFWRLLAIIMVCWFALLSVTLTVTLRYSLRTLREQIDSILMSTVVTLGDNPDVRQTVEQGCIEPGLADYLTDVIVNTECLEYITVDWEIDSTTVHKPTLTETTDVNITDGVLSYILRVEDVAFRREDGDLMESAEIEVQNG